MCLSLAAARGLETMMGALVAEPVLDRVLWNDDRAGLRIGVLAPGIDEPRAVAGLVRSVARVVLAVADAPVRLALHEGLVSLAGGQWCGPAITDVAGLGRHPLEPSPGGLTVLLSHRVHDDLARLGRGTFPLSGFRPVASAPVPAHTMTWDLGAGS
ncbi:hypothetical protein [Actinocorallia longicatena]|uniref:Uncharacterized protein n=1 Tax=Actinocorallia longicatena TaxID=111803 RepID=A0ABP6QI51_9ACTN